MENVSMITKILSSKKETTIKEIINTLSINKHQKIPINTILSQSAHRDMNNKDTRYILKRLMYKGEIYEPEAGFFSKL